MIKIIATLVCIAYANFSGGFASADTPDNTSCKDNERIALLEFKQGLTDPASRLSSWGVGLKDCCKWEGIRCSNRTGHVTRLQLRNPSTSDDYGAMLSIALGGKISPSLLELKHLSYLDLSWNYFDGASIPEFFGSFPRLRYLNLSDAGFSGEFPRQLGNLTNLRYLDLGWNLIPPADISVDWLSQLSSLQYLDLSQTDVPAGVFDAINKLPFLSVVKLSSCGLYNITSSLSHVNFSRLSTIVLSKNLIDSIPDWLFGIKSLKVVDLSDNNRISGSISGFGNLSSLEELYLAFNQFTDSIPKNIGNLCKLKILDLSSNVIGVDISEFQKGLSGCAINSLQTLNLGYNHLSGKFPYWLGLFNNLSELHLNDNVLSGSIPESIGRWPSLRYLYLANNRLEGSLPEALWQLSELVVLDLSSNSLGGSISNAQLSNLTKLEVLGLSSNSIILNTDSEWVPPFQLKEIHLASCVIGPRFPDWIKTQRMFSTIDISNGSISDLMPDWFWSLSPQIYQLNLSYNQISGSIPVSVTFDNMLFMDLRSNQFHGPLPHVGGVKNLFLSNNFFSGSLIRVLNTKSIFTSILLSNNLVNGSIPQSICGVIDQGVLDLSNNLLSGEIPNCPEVNMDPGAISLANNNLSGHIPKWIGSLNELQSLHLNNNSLSGKIPSLRNCTMLTFLDLGENKLEGNIPAWIGESLHSLMILRLRSNMFEGNIPHQLSNLTSLQVLDLSRNKLKGVIPRWIGNLTAMASTTQDLIDYVYGEGGPVRDTNLNFVYEESMLLGEKGQELKYSHTLSLVVSLDLSENSFSGDIPEELMNLIGLESLNLSGNHLKGMIPDKISHLHRLETLDLSRNQFCGAIPSSISSLTFLSHLNLSHNNLSGRIPIGNQLQTLDPSIYEGNHDLCGIPLPNKCPGEEVFEVPIPDTKGTDESETIWIFTGGVIGFVVGIWGFWGTLLLKKSWRFSYFKIIDNIQYRWYGI